MRFVTYNMRGGGSLAHWSALLGAFAPDIAFVQETKNPAAFPLDAFEPLDFRGGCWTTAGHGKWGSALWVREGALEPVTLESACWWAAGGVVRVGGCAMLALSVHLAPLGHSYVASANNLLDTLRDQRTGAGMEVVLAGDWNLAVSSHLPNGKRTNSKGELALLERLETEFDLVSAWTAAHPDVEPPQTLRWASNPRIPYHCDGLFIPRAWCAGIGDVRVHSGKPWHPLSDHNPVVLDVDPPRPSRGQST